MREASQPRAGDGGTQAEMKNALGASAGAERGSSPAFL
jgi:hypothetical protein